MILVKRVSCLALFDEVEFQIIPKIHLLFINFQKSIKGIPGKDCDQSAFDGPISRIGPKGLVGEKGDKGDSGPQGKDGFPGLPGQNVC